MLIYLYNISTAHTGRPTTSLESLLGIERAQNFSPRMFSFEELAIATRFFSNNRMLGDGDYGRVYKGELDGMAVAIKKLSLWVGAQMGGEQMVNRINHDYQYLNKLIGYCNEESDKFLVYEFVPNKTLRFHLHGESLTIRIIQKLIDNHVKDYPNAFHLSK